MSFQQCVAQYNSALPEEAGYLPSTKQQTKLEQQEYSPPQPQSMGLKEDCGTAKWLDYYFYPCTVQLKKAVLVNKGARIIIPFYTNAVNCILFMTRMLETPKYVPFL